MIVYKKFLASIFLKAGLMVLFLLLVRSESVSERPVFAASAGGITNLQSANGQCDGGGAYGLGRCKQGSINYTMKAFACGADNGNDPTHCNDNWQFNGTPTWNAMNNGGYYEIGKYVWPLQTSGVTQNDWVCKVQIDIFNGSTLLDYVVWRDPQRCGSAPPPQAPFYTAIYPVNTTVSSLYPTFTWQTNADTSGISYNNICLYGPGAYASGPCVYSPSTSARSFTATTALPPSTGMYWLIYGCKPGCAGGGYGTAWTYFITPAVPGTLSISTTPVSGGIYVDGSYVGSGSWSGSYYTSSHTVSFGAVAGYTTPANQAGNVTNGNTTTVTGTYVAATATLTVTKSGTGTGTVTSNPAGINCGATCSYAFNNGTSVVLSAAATAGSTFTGWSGEGCSGTGTCTVAMSQARSVTAIFTASAYTLTTAVAPAGAGSVSKSPNQATYTYGTNVTLTASVGTGYTFANWGGDLSGSVNPSTLTMNANKSVTANFSLTTYTVSTSVNPAGAGTFSPASRTVTYGNTTTFTVSPGAGYAISSVTGCGGTLLGTVYTTGVITGICTVSGTFSATTGTISGSVFRDDGSGGGVAANGIKDGSETGVSGSTVYLVSTSTNVNTTTNVSGGFSFSLVDPTLSYRLEVSYPPTGFWTVNTPGNGWSDTLAHPYYTGGPRPYTKNSLAANPDFPLTVAVGNTLTVNLGLIPVPAGDVTINVYNDTNGDGTIISPESFVSVPVVIKCSSSSGTCPASNTTSGGVVSLSLASGKDYSFEFDPADPTNTAAGFVRVTGLTTSSGTCAGQICNISSLPAGPVTVNFDITKNLATWIQVWDGDVYSNFANNPSTAPGIRITVPLPGLVDPAYHPYFIQTQNAGGLTLTRTGSTGAICPSTGAACSEKGWMVGNYNGLDWPSYLVSYTGTDGACNNNVCYAASSITISNSGTYNSSEFKSGGTFYNKILIVNGDVNIQTNGVATGNTPAIFGVLVARGGSGGSTGKLTVDGPSNNNELTISGGLYAKDTFDFIRSLNNNNKPSVAVIYNPAIMTQVTSFSQPAYTWREVVAL